MFKRVILFVLTNLVVMLTLGLIWGLLEAFTPLGAWMNAQGPGLAGFMVVCFFWGMGGSIISLLISRWIAKRSTGATVLNPDQVSGDERWLVDTVHRLAREAGIKAMPEVAVYPSPELNAFATGPTKNKALVAVSEGLLSSLNKPEIEGVLGHELSHVANGDMVTLTLVQGVVNAFVMFLSWVITVAISQAIRGKDEDRRGGFGDYMLRSLIHSVVNMGLMFAAYVAIVAPFSRWREFGADAGGAAKAGKAKMIAALEALKAAHENALAQKAEAQAVAQAPALTAFKISGNWSSLMSTHPPIDERIARLKNL